MKKVLYSFSAVLLSISIFSACRSNSTASPDDTTNVDTTHHNTIQAGMTATINGTAWSGQVGGLRHAGPLQNLQFEGWTGSGLSDLHQIAIGLNPAINSTGTYPVDDSTVLISYVQPVDRPYNSNPTGTLTISVLTDNNVQGSFGITLQNSQGQTVTIMNGKFNVPLL